MQGKERSSELSFPLGILIREIVGSPSFNVQYVKIIPLYLNKKNFFFLSSISFTKILYRRTFSNFLLSFINRRIKTKKKLYVLRIFNKEKKGGVRNLNCDEKFHEYFNSHLILQLRYLFTVFKRKLKG